MANTGKYVSAAKDIESHAAWIAAIMAIKPEVKPHYFFEVGDACALLGVDAKTLQRKRKLRDLLLSKGEDPDPLDLSTIPYVPPRPAVKYSAQDLEDFLKRLYAATKLLKRFDWSTGSSLRLCCRPLRRRSSAACSAM